MRRRDSDAEEVIPLWSEVVTADGPEGASMWASRLIVGLVVTSAGKAGCLDAGALAPLWGMVVTVREVPQAGGSGV